MPQKGQARQLLLAAFLSIVLLALLPTLMESIRTAAECSKIKEELSLCKANLESCYEDLENYRRRIDDFNTQLSQCRDKINQLNTSLSECQTNLSRCQLDLASEIGKVGKLSECCNNLEVCEVELQKCKESIGKITHLNMRDYNIVFGSITVNMSIFMEILYIVIPISLALELISIRVKFNESTERILSFIKVFSNLIVLSLIISFFIEIPLYFLIFLSFLFTVFWIIKK